MYVDFFVKIWMKKEKLLPYERSDIQAFNKIITCPWGYVELMVTLREG